MPILDTTLGQKELLLKEVISENPLLTIHSFFDFPPPVVDGNARVSLVGKQGRNSEGLTGKRVLHYPQYDLAVYFKNVDVRIPAYRPSSVHDLLPILASRYGLKLDPAYVHDDPVAELPATVQIRFKEGALFFKQPALSVQLQILPLPVKPIDLTTYILSELMSGFVNPATKVDLTQITQEWHVDTPALADWLAQRTAGGAYDTSTLAQVVNEASLGNMGTWACVNANQPLNLWDTYIVSNGVNDDPVHGLQYPRRIILQTAANYLPNVTGLMTIYY